MLDIMLCVFFLVILLYGFLWVVSPDQVEHIHRKVAKDVKEFRVNRPQMTWKFDKNKAYAWEPPVTFDATFADPTDSKAIAQERKEWWQQDMEGLTGAWKLREEFEALLAQAKGSSSRQWKQKLPNGTTVVVDFEAIEKFYAERYGELMKIDGLTKMPRYRYIKPYPVHQELVALPSATDALAAIAANSAPMTNQRESVEYQPPRAQKRHARTPYRLGVEDYLHDDEEYEIKEQLFSRTSPNRSSLAEAKNFSEFMAAVSHLDHNEQARLYQEWKSGHWKVVNTA